jgi:hypothetical protein
MRSVLVLGLLITLSASANAATAHRAKPLEGHLRAGQRVPFPKGYAVPGWTDEETGSGCITARPPLAYTDSRCQSGRMSERRRPCT